VVGGQGPGDELAGAPGGEAVEQPLVEVVRRPRAVLGDGPVGEVLRLASLQYLPISSLKIDRTFVARLDLDPEDDAMVAAVIGLAHTLGLAVIAEGVETPRQLAKLDELGCDYAQGYLFARPETAGRVGELLGQDPRQDAGRVSTSHPPAPRLR
jgi:predicted signal transduction protein with EAL and GGDEF domain